MPPPEDTAGVQPGDRREPFLRRVAAKVVEAVTVHLAVTATLAGLSVVGAVVGTAVLTYRSAETAKPGSASTPTYGRLVPGMSVGYSGLTMTVTDRPNCMPLSTDSTKASCEIPTSLVNETGEPQRFNPLPSTYLYVGLLRFPVEHDLSWPSVFPGRSATTTLRFIVPVGSAPTRLEFGGPDRTFYFT
jgi:hypothetical protein